MKKVKMVTVFMAVALMIIPFATFSKAQAGYVGITEGNEYEWRINVNLEGVNNVMQNVDDLMTEIQTRISDLELFGFADKTVPEAMVNISHRILNYILPPGWEGLNITELLEETLEKFLEDFNSTVLNGNIPSNWDTLNYNTFMDYVVDGLNSTLPVGWEEHPIPHLISSAINAFNNSILFGLVPENWDQMTLESFFESIIAEAIPYASESFILSMYVDEMLSQLYAIFPPGLEGQIIADIWPYMLPSNIYNLNLTTILNGLWLFVNSTSPPGWDTMPMGDFIENGGYYINYMLSGMDPTLDGADASAIVDWGIGYAMYMINATMPSGILPANWMDMSIQELAIYMVELGKTMFAANVLPGWNSMYSNMVTYGVTIPTTYGLKARIDDIKTEIVSPLGGQRATEFDVSLFFSMDMQNWTNIDDLLSGSSISMDGNITVSWLSTLLDATMQGYIVDPSSYSDPKIALMDQVAFTKGLIVATNYDWSTITTDITIEANGNVDAYEASASWNSMGLLNQATLSSDGVTAISISYHTAEQQEIPGYEITLMMIVIPVSIIGIIYYINKKNR